MKKRLFYGLGIGIIFIGIQASEIVQIRNLNTKIEDIEWSLEFQGKVGEDIILPDVGTIQFLKRGYSIQIENVKYTADGLYMKGFIGNPLLIWISNLTLEFTATKNLYEYRDEFRKNRYVLMFGPEAIGKAQTSIIASLPPKERAEFEVTIPNIKQTKEGVRIVVRFTGERYSYGS